MIGAYRQQTMVMRLPLTESFDKIPDNLDDNVYVEFRYENIINILNAKLMKIFYILFFLQFRMPATTISKLINTIWKKI